MKLIICMIMSIVIVSCSKKEQHKLEIHKDSYSIIEIESFSNKSIFLVNCNTTDAQFGVMLAKEFATIAQNRGFSYFSFRALGSDQFQVNYYDKLIESTSVIFSTKDFE